MKNFIVTATSVLAFCLVSAPAFAGIDDAIAVPEPLSLSLLAGGIVAIAAVKGLRRK